MSVKFKVKNLSLVVIISLFSTSVFCQGISDTNLIWVNFISNKSLTGQTVYVEGMPIIYSTNVPVPSEGYWWLRCDPTKPVRLTLDVYPVFDSGFEFYKGDSILADIDKRTWTVINSKRVSRNNK